MTFLLSRHSSLVLFAFSIPAFAGSPAPGIKNFHQVDAHVYRGAQPSEEGFRYLTKIGDRTGAVVASYRIDRDRWDSGHALEEAMSLGMSFFQLPRQNYIRDFRPLGIESSHSAAGTPLATAPSVSNSAVTQ